MEHATRTPVAVRLHGRAIIVWCMVHVHYHFLPTGDGKMHMFGKAWFVGDSGLGQAGEGSTGALQDATDDSGLVYYFPGLERRGSKCLWSKLRWVAGELVRRAMGAGEQFLARPWMACWQGGAGYISSSRKPR